MTRIMQACIPIIVPLINQRLHLLLNRFLVDITILPVPLIEDLLDFLDVNVHDRHLPA